MNNLKKFATEAEYTAATLYYPAVSWVIEGDYVYFDKSAPTTSFSGLTVYYNITDISQPTTLFNGGGDGSGSGSGSGGVLPSAMVIDGTAVEVANTYQFSTTSEHIVNYSFADNQIAESFLDNAKGASIFSAVTKVEIGDAITSIGGYAFYNCSGLTSVKIGSGVTIIGAFAFGECGFTSIDIPDSVTSIGSDAFKSCTSITSITIPNGVTNISDEVFYNCTSLSSVTIPSGVRSIGNSVFYNCTSLSSVTIPSGVTSIGGYAFYGCSGLTSITSNATTAPIIISNAFQNVKTNGTLTVPSGSSGYDTWMQNTNYYLGLYNWTKVEQ